MKKPRKRSPESPLKHSPPPPQWDAPRRDPADPDRLDLWPLDDSVWDVFEVEDLETEPAGDDFAPPFSDDCEP